MKIEQRHQKSPEIPSYWSKRTRNQLKSPEIDPKSPETIQNPLKSPEMDPKLRKLLWNPLKSIQNHQNPLKSPKMYPRWLDESYYSTFLRRYSPSTVKLRRNGTTRSGACGSIWLTIIFHFVVIEVTGNDLHILIQKWYVDHFL